MPWQPRDLMTTKREFVQLAMQEGANRRELCRRFGFLPRLITRCSSVLQPKARRPSPSARAVRCTVRVRLRRLGNRPYWSCAGSTPPGVHARYSGDCRTWDTHRDRLPALSLTCCPAMD